jgi:hypothetical protein
MLERSWEIRDDPIIGRHYRETHNTADQNPGKNLGQAFHRGNEYQEPKPRVYCCICLLLKIATRPLERIGWKSPSPGHLGFCEWDSIQKRKMTGPLETFPNFLMMVNISRERSRKDPMAFSI